jgi:hypothetical protein
LIFGPLPQKESLEVYTLGSLTLGFSHLAPSSLFSQLMLSETRDIMPQRSDPVVH